jgi:MoaA/NifB/PqqE/SkfB family radical SAM enzyme
MKTFCPVPWNHFYIQTDNTQRLCAHSDAIVNDDVLKKIKNNMLNDLQSAECKRCYNDEKIGKKSRRILELNRNLYSFEDAKKDHKIYQTFDFKLSNHCNFQCIMCGPSASNKWEKELKQKHNKVIKNYDYLNNLHDAKFISFAGGEPFLENKVIDILEKLISIDNLSCEIEFLTNGSVFNKKIWQILSKFSNIKINVSVDGIGHIAEYIRLGTDWKTLEKNLQEFKKISDVRTQTTVQWLNLEHLKSIEDYFLNLNIPWYFHILRNPNFLNCNLLTKDILNEIDLPEKTKNSL